MRFEFLSRCAAGEAARVFSLKSARGCRVHRGAFLTARGNGFAARNEIVKPAPTTNSNMKQHNKLPLTLCLAGLVASGALVWQLHAAEAKDDVIKQVMKTYHKAPKGVDTVSKKAGDGKASATELKNLVAAYKTMTGAKPPKGDDASWKEKTSALLASAESLQKGEAGGAAKYKEAVNCKACHTAHKPD